MPKSNKVVPKKNRGRPATGRDPVTAIRLSSALRATVDAWAAKQDSLPGRSEAIRRLVELGLTVNTKNRLKKPAKRQQDMKQRSRDLAGEAIDEMADATASSQDQASRKRRLIKGPEEFQGIRRDRSTRK